MRAYILFPSGSHYENGWYSGDSLESIGRRLFGRSQYIWVRKRHNPEDPYPYAYYRQEPKLGHSVLLASVRYVEDEGDKPKGRPKSSKATKPRGSKAVKPRKASRNILAIDPSKIEVPWDYDEEWAGGALLDRGMYHLYECTECGRLINEIDLEDPDVYECPFCKGYVDEVTLARLKELQSKAKKKGSPGSKPKSSKATKPKTSRNIRPPEQPRKANGQFAKKSKSKGSKGARR